MSAEDQVRELLRKDGAVLLRRRKHLVWKLSNGKRFVTPSTPSDINGTRNSLSDLRKALGIVHTPKVGERKREKYIKKVPHSQSLVLTKTAPLPDWRAQLQVAAKVAVRETWWQKLIRRAKSLWAGWRRPAQRD